MTKSRFYPKKQPLQQRAKVTVAAIKEAAAHILREQGTHEFTTNKVAEKAGVSIGSLYQYFPSKESLIADIKRDHFAELRGLIKAAYERNKHSDLATIVRAFVDASIEAHRIDPELHKVLSGDLSDFQIKEDDNSDDSVRVAVIALLDGHRDQLRNNLDTTLAAKLIYKVVESSTHDTVLYHPELLDEADFANELSQMIMAYLQGSKIAVQATVAA